jgi:hypothetical protein
VAQAPLFNQQTSTLIAYGLIFGSSAVVGKILIDNFVSDTKFAKGRREFIGPIYEPPKGKADQVHVKLSDAVRFVAMGVSVYSMLAQMPELIKQWSAVEATVNNLVK